ncbi:hypothetical protein EVAR_65232_1 [Eumeta japonica]|uniref:Uncharacterized protein n=1 Tax=Eumeta variegata TaxID=151549 RepID=A0A4C1ZEW9_EUMVA|nr:hypothetical protein EVAR_65232_1 [Eumeta japonica]
MISVIGNINNDMRRPGYSYTKLRRILTTAIVGSLNTNVCTFVSTRRTPAQTEPAGARTMSDCPRRSSSSHKRPAQREGRRLGPLLGPRAGAMVGNIGIKKLVTALTQKALDSTSSFMSN